MSGHIEISVGDVTDVEAHVFARTLTCGDDAQHVSGPIAARHIARAVLRAGPHAARRVSRFAIWVRNEAGWPKQSSPIPACGRPKCRMCIRPMWKRGRGDEVVAEYHGTIGLTTGSHRPRDCHIE